MNTKRILIGTLVGGIAMGVLGYLIFELSCGRFYAANAGSATGVPREANLPWAVALGTFSLAALLTLAVESRAGRSTIGSNLTRTLVDPLLEFVRGGITGAIIAAVLARIAKPEFRAQART